jgi:Rieske Fe-S protein
MRSVLVEHRAGWANAVEEHIVYVLPNREGQVLSAVCPHEGCNVAWRDDAKNFACPCHDSAFAPDGARLYGPSRRGLDSLPSRVQNGVLQVQYQSFVNNTTERTVRA